MHIMCIGHDTSNSELSSKPKTQFKMFKICPVILRKIRMSRIWRDSIHMEILESYSECRELDVDGRLPMMALCQYFSTCLDKYLHDC